LVTVHAAAPPVGSVEVTMFSPRVPTHNRTEGHDTASNCTPVVVVHALAPPVGSVEVRIPLLLSVTTHRLADAHETASSALSPRYSEVSGSTFVTVHAPAPPVGSVEVTMLPPPTATHSSLDGHDTSVKMFATLAALAHAPVPPAGSVEISTSPTLSTATHKPVDGQDTPVMVVEDANGGWSSARTGLAQLSGEAASARPVAARRPLALAASTRPRRLILPRRYRR
jgi:hypothetical protein